MSDANGCSNGTTTKRGLTLLTESDATVNRPIDSTSPFTSTDHDLTYASYPFLIPQQSSHTIVIKYSSRTRKRTLALTGKPRARKAPILAKSWTQAVAMLNKVIELLLAEETEPLCYLCNRAELKYDDVIATING